MLPFTLLLQWVFLGLFSGIIPAEGKQFYRCELFSKLLKVPQINRSYLSHWICLIEHESERDTNMVKTEWNGSTKHGIFQISSKDGCGIRRKGGLCNKKCEDFLDDNIDDDVQCAKKIFDQNGFKYWQGWNNFCRDPRNLPNLAIVCPIHTLPD